MENRFGDWADSLVDKAACAVALIVLTDKLALLSVTMGAILLILRDLYVSCLKELREAAARAAEQAGTNPFGAAGGWLD